MEPQRGFSTHPVFTTRNDGSWPNYNVTDPFELPPKLHKSHHHRGHGVRRHRRRESKKRRTKIPHISKKLLLVVVGVSLVIASIIIIVAVSVFSGNHNVNVNVADSSTVSVTSTSRSSTTTSASSSVSSSQSTAATAKSSHASSTGKTLITDVSSTTVVPTTVAPTTVAPTTATKTTTIFTGSTTTPPTTTELLFCKNHIQPPHTDNSTFQNITDAQQSATVYAIDNLTIVTLSKMVGIELQMTVYFLESKNETIKNFSKTMTGDFANSCTGQITKCTVLALNVNEVDSVNQMADLGYCCQCGDEENYSGTLHCSMNGEEKTWQPVSLCGNPASIFDFIQNKYSIQICFKNMTKGMTKWFLGSVNSCWSSQPDIDITSDAIGSYKSASFVSGYIGLVGIIEDSPTSSLQLKVLGMPPFNCGNVQLKSVTSINVIDHGSTTLLSSLVNVNSQQQWIVAAFNPQNQLVLWQYYQDDNICQFGYAFQFSIVAQALVDNSLYVLQKNGSELLVQKITIDILPSQLLQKHGRQPLISSKMPVE